jgi:hypothetical protein
LQTSTDIISSQHFQKIRREAGDETSPLRKSVPKPANNINSAKSTPRKAKPMANSFSTSDSSSANSHVYEDDEEDMSTPMKRKRVMKSEGLEKDERNAPVFKFENQGWQDSPIDVENDA